MYLTRVRVENWRTLRDAVELVDLSPGLNVVHGPNETGKSTLMDAICRGFFDRHRTAGAEMNGRRPWGSELAPTVSVDFNVGGEAHRLEKRFLSGQSSVLYRAHEGRWEKVSDGQQADERIVALANGRAAGSGLTKPEHWGLGQVLWAGQGDATRLAVGDAQQARLREALQITLTPPAAAGIEDEVRRRFDATFTPRGQYRSGQNEAEVVRLRRELGEAESEVVRLDGLRREAEVVEHELRSALDERTAVAGRRAAVTAALEQASVDLRALAEAQRAYQLLEHDARQTQAEWTARNGMANAVAAADANRAAGRAEVARATAIAADAAGTLANAQAMAAQATAAREAAAVALARADDQRTAAERLLEFLVAREGLATATTALEKVTSLAARLAVADRELAELRAPSARQMAALRALDGRRRDQQARVEAASLTVTWQPAKSVFVRFDIDGAGPGAAFDGATSVRADAGMTVDLDGVGRLVVRAGSSDAATLSATLRELERQFRAAVVPFAADDLVGLETLAARGAALAATAGGIREAVAAAGDVVELTARVAASRDDHRRLVLEDPALPERTETVDVARQRVAEHRAGRRAFAAAVAASTAAERDAQVALAKADRAHGAAVASVGRAQAVMEERDREAARLRAGDGLSDDDRRSALAAALASADAARQRLAAAVRPPVDAAAQEVESHQRQLAALHDRLTALDQSVGNLRGRLDAAGAAGHYSGWAEATERVAQLRPQLARAELDAEAIKLLRGTLDKHRQQVFEAVVQPVRHMVTTSLGQLAGPRYDRVEFDEQLRPSTVHPAGRSDEVSADPDDLSFGTREQLMLLVRLTLGRLLSRTELGRHCVILDDPLVNADLRRQHAALRLMEEAAREAQVIVFTCHPHAYLSPSAKAYDLKSLVDAGRQAGAVG